MNSCRQPGCSAPLLPQTVNNEKCSVYPLKYVYGWLFTINPKNVSDEARPAVMRYRVECYNALYDHFNRQAKRVAEENRAEIEALEEIARLTQEMGESKQHLAEAKKRLESIRTGRLDSQPSLFD